MAVPSKPRKPARDSYRHGDLRRALVDEGVALAREGGPSAVTLREATRRAGVAPNAAYRHFDGHDALFAAVRSAALAALARSIEAHWRDAERTRGPKARARALLRAVGIGYVEFAQCEAGLFRTAFGAGAFDVQRPTNPERTGALGMNPFELLGAALDAMVACGALPAARRPDAEFLAWSAVHGMACLCTDGPLRNTPPAYRTALGERLVEMVEKGLASAPGRA